jgi:hypothetical protein
MKFKLVPESLNESLINEISGKRHFLIFYNAGGTKSRAYTTEGLERVENRYPEIFDDPNIQVLVDGLKNSMRLDVMLGPKLNIHLLWRKLSGAYRGSEEDMKRDILKIAPKLGITKQLALSEEEKKQLLFQEGMVSEDIDPAYFKKHEINNRVEDMTDVDELLPEDIVIRSSDGSTTPVAYRFPKRLEKKMQNWLKGHYASEHGDTDKSWWKSYLDVRPIMAQNIRNDDHLWRTSDESHDEDIYQVGIRK